MRKHRFLLLSFFLPALVLLASAGPISLSHASGTIEVVSARWGDGYGRECGTIATNPPILGAIFGITVREWRSLTDTARLQTFLDGLREEGITRCPSAEGVTGSIYAKDAHRTLVNALWRRATNSWTIDAAGIAVVTRVEEQEAAAAKEKKDREDAEARQREEKKRTNQALQALFISQFKPEIWSNQSKLMANVFLYKDKIVGVHASFNQMVAPNEALFGQLYVADVPGTEFVTTGQEVILALRVTGLKATRIMGLDINIPQGRYVGAYQCKQPGCGEFFE
jgi:hypothetical protein